MQHGSKQAAATRQLPVVSGLAKSSSLLPIAMFLGLHCLNKTL